MCEKDYISNPATCSWENGIYLPSIIDDSVIRYGEMIGETKTVPVYLNKKKNATCKTKNVYILLVFLLITIALLISVSVYCYPIKYKAKQK